MFCFGSVQIVPVLPVQIGMVNMFVKFMIDSTACCIKNNVAVYLQKATQQQHCMAIIVFINSVVKSVMAGYLL